MRRYDIITFFEIWWVKSEIPRYRYRILTDNIKSLSHTFLREEIISQTDGIYTQVKIPFSLSHTFLSNTYSLHVTLIHYLCLYFLSLFCFFSLFEWNVSTTTMLVSLLTAILFYYQRWFKMKPNNKSLIEPYFLVWLTKFGSSNLWVTYCICLVSTWCWLVYSKFVCLLKSIASS